jgi:hypothetical protein
MPIIKLRAGSFFPPLLDGCGRVDPALEGWSRRSTGMANG